MEVGAHEHRAARVCGRRERATADAVLRDGYVWEQALGGTALFADPRALFDAARLASARSGVRIRLFDLDAPPPPNATP